MSEEKKIQLSYTKKSYYQGELNKILLRRVKRYLKSRDFDPLGQYEILENHSSHASFLETYLKEIYPRLELKMVRKIGIAKKTLVTTTLDQDVSLRFTEFIDDGVYDDELLRPLSVCTEEELKALGMFTSKKTSIHPLLAELEKQQAGTLFSLSKSLELVKNKKNK